MGNNKFQIKSAATYAKLMEAGMETFCEKGYTTAAIDEIARRAGYTKGAFYAHFDNKADFFKKMITYRREMRADTHAQMEQLYHNGAGLEELISFLAEGLVQYLDKTPRWSFVYIDFFLQSGQEVSIQEVFKTYYESWIAETKGNIEWLYQKGLVPSAANTMENAKQIYAILDGFITHQHLYGETFDGVAVTRAMLKLLQ